MVGSYRLQFIRLGLQTAILGFGAWLVLEGQLTAGGMIAGSILLARAMSPIDQAISSWRGAVQARQAYGRLKKTVSGPSPPHFLPLDPVRIFGVDFFVEDFGNGRFIR